jgi:hypothetical protein
MRFANVVVSRPANLTRWEAGRAIRLYVQHRAPYLRSVNGQRQTVLVWNAFEVVCKIDAGASHFFEGRAMMNSRSPAISCAHHVPKKKM